MKASNKMVYIIHTDNLDHIQDSIGIYGVFTSKAKAEKESSRLNEKAGDDVYTVESYPIMK